MELMGGARAMTLNQPLLRELSEVLRISTVANNAHHARRDAASPGGCQGAAEASTISAPTCTRSRPIVMAPARKLSRPRPGLNDEVFQVARDGRFLFAASRRIDMALYAGYDAGPQRPRPRSQRTPLNADHARLRICREPFDRTELRAAYLISLKWSALILFHDWA